MVDNQSFEFTTQLKTKNISVFSDKQTVKMFIDDIKNVFGRKRGAFLGNYLNVAFAHLCGFSRSTVVA